MGPGPGHSHHCAALAFHMSGLYRAPSARSARACGARARGACVRPSSVLRWRCSPSACACMGRKREGLTMFRTSEDMSLSCLALACRASAGSSLPSSWRCLPSTQISFTLVSARAPRAQQQESATKFRPGFRELGGFCLADSTLNGFWARQVCEAERERDSNACQATRLT